MDKTKSRYDTPLEADDGFRDICGTNIAKEAKTDPSSAFKVFILLGSLQIISLLMDKTGSVSAGPG